MVFLLMDTAGSSAGLIAVYDSDARGAALVEYYGAAGRLYPAYITLALFPAMVRAARSGLPGLMRLGAALMAAGTVAMTMSLSSPVIPASLAYLRFVFSCSAILGLIVGLAMIWLAKIVARKTRKAHNGLTG